RVGEGPLPSENREIADLLHDMGREFGATTGRPRRCGWFDAVVVKQAVMVNGIDDLAVTNLDGLDTVERIKVCVAYQVDGKRYDYMPNDIDLLGRCQPIYEEVPGWMTSVGEARCWSELPQATRDYLGFIAEKTGAALGLISVGPGRDQTFPAE
ncbi:MAG: adenylosuccinate synthetase, partial [Verrucomicrobia bacterium]|nr:adenylosuccinate synthetase [Verrucomicrobiota bacterium]